MGILMVYSASNAVSRESRGDSYYFLKKQVLWCCIGLLAMTIAASFNYRKYKSLAWPLLGLSCILLVFVYIPGIGIRISGGARWIRIWKLSFQPVELAKLALVICIAKLLNRNGDEIRNFKSGIFPGLLLLTVFIALIIKQPDFGSLVIMALVTFIMLFVGGAKINQMAWVTLVAVVLAAIAVLIEPYRLRRLLIFLDPWKDPKGAGYHIIQSFYALGCGGILGTGLGAGMQKLHYLPTPHNDFIFSVIGEELGLIGAVFITVLFMAIVWRGIHIALSTRNRFGSMLAFGIASLIGIQAIINIGVVTGSLPTKGLTLPFISSGGTSILISMISVGILLNISKDAQQNSGL
jgi:cell division protein FtsW